VVLIKIRIPVTRLVIPINNFFSEILAGIDKALMAHIEIKCNLLNFN